MIDDYMIQTLIIYQKDDSDNGDDDDTTSVIKGTKSTIARSAASLKTVANGAYTFPSDATISGINDINGGIQNNIFFIAISKSKNPFYLFTLLPFYSFTFKRLIVCVFPVMPVTTAYRPLSFFIHFIHRIE